MEMISDNSSNFIGAERELWEWVDVAAKKKINDSTADKGINQIVFKSTLATHFGGVHKSKN